METSQLLQLPSSKRQRSMYSCSRVLARCLLSTSGWDEGMLCLLCCSGVPLQRRRKRCWPPQSKGRLQRSGVHCTGRMGLWRCVCGCVGRGKREGGGEGELHPLVYYKCVCESCTSHACTDLSNTKIQTCVFCEKLFVCSQNSYGQWTCTVTKVIHMTFM